LKSPDTDVCRAAARLETLGGHVAGGIAIAGDVEPGEHRGEVECCEMIGRQRGDHRQAGQHAFERQHGLDAFAGEQYVARTDARVTGEAHAVAEQMAERPARIGERRLVGTRAARMAASRLLWMMRNAPA
jgi:hypothetical protein